MIEFQFCFVKCPGLYSIESFRVYNNPVVEAEACAPVSTDSKQTSVTVAWTGDEWGPAMMSAAGHYQETETEHGGPGARRGLKLHGAVSACPPDPCV